jgi:autotransporter-associated beta strand protein
MISQNWYPMYTSGTGNWESSTWSTTSASGYTKAWAKVGGHDADAVFEGTGGTVTVSTTVNANSLNFMTDSTMAGYTIQGSGTINLTGDAIITTGAGTDNIAGNMYGQTTINQGGGANTISCVLAGTAGMYKAGGGTLILTGANTYINSADRTSDTTVGGGTLQIGNGGASGSITGNVNNLANLAFNHSGTFVFGGNIIGTGSVDIASTATGGGTTVFTADHTYTGVTTVHANNTLQLGNGSTTGSITGDVIVNAATATLAFNHSNTLTYAGNIYGAGGVTQTGAGRVILTGNNAYTGLTTVKTGGTIELGANAEGTVLVHGADVQNGATSVGSLVFDYSGATAEASLLNSIRADLHSGLFKDSLAGTLSNGAVVTLGYSDNGSSSITLEPMLAGDANHDGSVDIRDFTLLKSSWLVSSGATWANGDFNADGSVDIRDFTLLKTNWLKTWAPTLPAVSEDVGALGGVSPVPEPSSLMMLGSLISLGAMWVVSRRRRNPVA